MTASSKDVQNFKFKQIEKLRIFKCPEIEYPYPTNLVAVSSKYGLIFIGHPQGFQVLRIDVIANTAADLSRTEIDSYSHQQISLSAAPVTHLARSNDDLTLAVCTSLNGCQFAYLYDIRAFADANATPEPFSSIRLSADPSAQVLEVAWNPVADNSIAVCTSDGAVSVYEVSENGMKIAGSLPSATGATAICWSPKGKQLVIGMRNGSFSQFKPNLQLVKSVPSPTIFENPCSVLSINWLSNFCFAVAYKFSSDSDNQPTLVIVSTPKTSAVTYIDYGDICFSGGDQRPAQYLMFHQPDWGVLLCVSSNAMEVGVLGISSEDKAIWEQWNLEDTSRAELPLAMMDESHKIGTVETYPIGMAVCYNSNKDIRIDEHQVIPPMPIFMMLSTDGLLCLFYMMNLDATAPSLVHPARQLTADGQRKERQLSTLNPEARVFQPSYQVETSGMALQSSIISPLKPAPVRTQLQPADAGLAHKANFIDRSNEANQESSRIGVPTPNSTSLPVGGRIGMTTSSSPLAPAGTFNFPVNQVSNNQTSGRGSITSGTPLPVKNIKVLPGAPPTVAATTPIPSSPKPTSSLLPQARTSAGADSPNAFDFSIGKMTTSAVTATTILPNLGKSTGNTLLPTPVPQKAFYSGPLQSLATVTQKAGISITPSISSQPTSAFQPLTLFSTPTCVPRNDKRDGSSEETRKQQSFKDGSKPLHEKSVGFSCKDIYTAAIKDELCSFQSEMMDFKERSAQMNFWVDSVEEMQNLKQRTEKINKYMAEIKDTMLGLDQEMYSLRVFSLESLAAAEDARTRELQQEHPVGRRSAMRGRPLDPMNIHRMRHIWQLYHYLESQLQEAERQLDERWDKLKINKKKHSEPRYIPSTETIYQSILNIQNVLRSLTNTLNSQAESVEQLKGPGKFMANWQRLPTSTFSELESKMDISKLSDLLLEARLTPNKPMLSRLGLLKKLSRFHTSQLRTVLCERIVTPVRSSAPGKLSRLILPDSIYEQSMARNGQEEVSGGDEIGSPLPPLSVFPAPDFSSTPAQTSSSLASGQRHQGPSMHAHETSAVPLLFTPAISTTASPMPGVFTAAAPSQMAGIRPAFQLNAAVAAPKSAVGTTKPEPATETWMDGEGKVPASVPSALLGKHDHNFASLPMFSSTPASPGAQKPVPTSASLFSFRPHTQTLEMVPTSTVTPSKGTLPSQFPIGSLGARSEEGGVTSAFSLNLKPITDKLQSSPNAAAVESSAVSPAMASFIFEKPAATGEGAVAETFAVSATTVPASISISTFSFGNRFGSADFASTPFSTPSASPFQFKPVEADTSLKPNMKSLSSAFSFSLSGKPALVGDAKQASFLFSSSDTKSNVFQFGDVMGSPAIGLLKFAPPNTPDKTKDDATPPCTPTDELEKSVEVAEATKQGEGLPPDLFIIEESEEVITELKQISGEAFAGAKDKGRNTDDIKLSVLEMTEVQPVTSAENLQAVLPTIGTLSSAFVKPSTILSNSQQPILKLTTPKEATMTVSSISDSTAVSSDAPKGFESAAPPTMPGSASDAASIVATSSAAEAGAAPVIEVASPAFISPASVAPNMATGFGNISVASGTTTLPMPIFGQQTLATTVTSGFPISTFSFTKASSTQAENPNSSAAQVFSLTPSVSSSSPSFSFPLPQAAPTSIFGGQPPATGFGFGTPQGGTTTTTTTFPFGQSGTSSLFGGSAASTAVSPAGSTSMFGQKPVFGGQASFGQTSSLAFGQPANATPSLFGNSGGSAFSQSPPVFGQTNLPSFGQPSPAFGSQNTNLFGQNSTGLFGGLGGKPSAENVNKNVFGGLTTFGSAGQATSLFGNQSPNASGGSSFGSKFGDGGGGAFGSGSFSGGGSSVAQTGFGGFQQPQQPPQTHSPHKPVGGFGSSPSFGGTPAFGSSPSFGASPVFSGGSPLPPAAFGSPVANQQAGFGSFSASTTAPTFGSLASQGNNVPTFGNVGSVGVPTFGGSPQPAFGSPPSFGAPSGFGSPPSTGQSSSWTSYR